MGGFVDVGLAVWRPGTGALEPMGQEVKASGKKPERGRENSVPGSSRARRQDQTLLLYCFW